MATCVCDKNCEHLCSLCFLLLTHKLQHLFQVNYFAFIAKVDKIGRTHRHHYFENIMILCMHIQHSVNECTANAYENLVALFRVFNKQRDEQTCLSPEFFTDSEYIDFMVSTPPYNGGCYNDTFQMSSCNANKFRRWPPAIMLRLFSFFSVHLEVLLYAFTYRFL